MIRRLVGVYDAGHTLMGGISYLVGTSLGRRDHCALCDITHGTVRQRPEWKDCRATLSVPFDTYYLDNRPADLLACSDAAPIVAAETDEGFMLLLGPDDIAACAGSIDKLLEAINEAVAARDLTLPS